MPGTGPRVRSSLPLAVVWVVAWSWLLLSTFVSWSLHPLRAAADSSGSASELVARHLVHGLGLLLFAVLCRWRPANLFDPVLGWVVVGLGYVLAHPYFGANELAGILLFFIPWALAAALVDPSPRLGNDGHSNDGTSNDGTSQGLARRFDHQAGRLATLGAALLFLGMLYHTSSRSGLGACVLVLTPMLWCLGRMGRRLVQTVGGIAVLWLLAGGWRTFLEFFVFDDKGQRLTVYTFLTGRPHIWLRHAQAVADMPFTGVGLGASEKVVAELYPLSRFEPRVRVEDAHNLFLHIASELGLPSLLALLTLLTVAAWRLLDAWRRVPEGRHRARVLGMAAGLSAYLIYGSVDVVAFGQIGSLPFWCLLGLACRPSPCAEASTLRPRRLPSPPIIVLSLALLAALLAWSRHAIDFNLAALETAHTLLVAPQDQDRARRQLARHKERRCHSHYFLARLAASRGDTAARDDAYRALFRCSDDFDDLVAFLLPDHTELAEEATRWHPQSAAAHLWRGRQLATGDAVQRLRAEAHYRTALDLKPEDGRAWIELGNLLYHQDRRQALDAYGEACRRGDYYGQGCWLAGATARQLGDLEAAIHYYRSSRMPGSQAFAQGLEVQRLRQQGKAPP